MIVVNAWRVIIAVVAIVAAYIAVAFKRRKSIKLVTATGNVALPSHNPTSNMVETGKLLASAHIDMEFPHLNSPHPDVWGANEELIFTCRLTDEGGNPVANRSIQIHIDNRRAAELTTNDRGICRVKYTPHLKGFHLVDCRFGGNEQLAPCGQQRKIRIVDYRQEAVRLFNNMKKSAISVGLAINDQSTPRDVATSLLDAYADIDSAKLDRFICRVEESLYSSHHFGIERYSDMLSNYPQNSILLSS